MTSYAKSNLNTVKRVPEFAAYDPAEIYPIVDAALICHVGFIDQGRAMVIPTIHTRDGDSIILHGSVKSRLMQLLAAGADISISVTLLDGLLLARSVFSHAMNYRSAVLFGKSQPIESDEERFSAMQRITEKLVPGRWDDAKQPDLAHPKIKATQIVRVPIETASAKVSAETETDENPADLDLDVWAGILPMRTVFGEFMPAKTLKPGVQLPQYLRDYQQSMR